MTQPTFEAFSQLAKHGNFVPVYKEWVADLDTPVSAWYKVCAGQPYNFLLESVESVESVKGGKVLGRYSLLGCDPLWVLEARGTETVQTYRNGDRQTFEGNPFDILSHCLSPYKPVRHPDLPSSIGGLFGFWGYELIHWIEPRVPIYPIQPDDLPDGVWMQIDQLLIFDQVTRKIWAIAYADLRPPNTNLVTAYDTACHTVQQLVGKLQNPIPTSNTSLTWTSPQAFHQQKHSQSPSLPYISNIDKDTFCQNVAQAKDYIRAGDIFQVVLSQRLSTKYKGDPFSLYRSLRLINPSPYMTYLQFKDWQIIGSSPEIMVNTEKTSPSTPYQSPELTATLRPIAGTRRRGTSVKEDQTLATDLLNDPKECAEHVMLVDLGRNDLGRVCRKGSVTVDKLMIIEYYSHVMHIVSNVIGTLDSTKTAWNLLQACFPAGTVSGAPKIRAMEIIHELEPCRRGPYSGVYGYYDFEGQLNTAITIRTMVVQPDEHGILTVSVQAGAGLVADSIPEKEYEETLNKAQALLEAIRCLE